MSSPIERKVKVAVSREVWCCLIVVLLVATVLRVQVWYADPFSYEPKEDSLQYHMLAQNLVEHGTMSLESEPPYSPSARRVPGYPLFLASVYSLVGPSVNVVKLVQILFGLATCAFVFLIASRALQSNGLGIIVAAAVALSPPLIGCCNRLMPEALFAVLLLVSTYATYRWVDSARPAWSVVCGLLWGWLTLVKPEAALLPVAVVPATLFVARSRKAVAIQSLLAVAAMAAIVTPWLYRNYTLLGRLAMISGSGDGSGPGPLHGYRLRAENGFTFRPERYTFAYRGDIDELERRFQQALDKDVQNPEESDAMFWARRPGLLAKYCGVRFVGLMIPRSGSTTFGLDGTFGEYKQQKAYFPLCIKAGMLLLDAVVLAVCGIGFLVSFRPKHRQLWIITATVAYFIAIYSFLHGISRYRVPLLPLLILLGVFWLAGLVGKRRPFDSPSETA